MSGVLREYRLLAILVGVSAVVALSAIPGSDAPRALPLLGIGIGLLYYFVASWRERRRQRLFEAPFPPPWRTVLERRIPLYALLSPSERQHFEGEIQVFLGEQRIYALGGLEREKSLDATPQSTLSDESKLLIAASAATLLLGRPEWRLPTVRDIVVYPTAFAEGTYKVAGSEPSNPDSIYTAHESHAHAVGMVHEQGPILLSLDALEMSYPVHNSIPGWSSRTQLDLGQPVLPHVGLHEFAHVLDFIGRGSSRPTGHNGGQSIATGIPTMLPAPTALRWHQQLAVERDRLLIGKSILSPYGLKNEAELFAVSVESFFQDALRMRVYHPDLYTLLAEFFNQDPAARLVAHHAAFVFRPWFALGPTSRYTA